MSTKALLQRHAFTRDLSEAHLDQLALCVRSITYPEGAFVFREGGDASELYLILEGRVALEQYVPGRGVVQLESLDANDILGLSWMLPGGRWILDARATEPAELIAVDARCLQARMEQDSTLGFALSKQLIQALYQRLERTRLQRLDVYGKSSW
jgi:CRP-like cAMP-binding protein